MTIIKRADLGRPLTWDELDDNFRQVDELTASASAAVSSAAGSATAAAGSATNSLNSANSAAGSADDAAASATVAINALMNSTFEPSDFDFTTGGTLDTTDRNKAVYNLADNNWYSWSGTLPKIVSAGEDPTADTNWKPRTDQILRANLASDTGSNLIGFKNIGASAQKRSVQDRLRDVFNAKDYGIKGDGVTDDSAAAQALVDYVSSLGGGAIYWPKGVYKLNFINKANVCHVGCTFGAVRGVISYGAAITKYATQFTPATAGWIIDTPVGGGDCGGVIGIDFKGGGLTLAGGGVNLRAGSYDWIVTACKWDYFADEALVTNGLIGRFSDLSGTNCLLNRTRSARTGVFVFNGADNFIERIQGNTGITAIQSSDLYLCGILIGGANNYAVNLEGELSEIGISVTATGAMHKLINCRADLNYGHGFYGSAIMSNCHALNNSNGNSGVYSGFVMNNRSQLSNCRADGTHKYGLDWISSADQAGLELKPRVAAFHSTGHVTAAIADTLFNGFLHTMYNGFQRGTGSTPNVEGVNTYVPTDTVATDITDLLGGVKGQRVVIFGNPNITLVRSSTFIVKGCTSDGRKSCRLGGTYEFWRGNGIWYEVGAQTPAVGTTALRPSAFSWPGDQYFDTTLNKPIWRNAAGNGWVDATGTAV